MSRQPDPLLTAIETALTLYEVSATRFGYAAAGDPALIKKLRDGRRIKKAALRARVVAALARLEKGETL